MNWKGIFNKIFFPHMVFVCLLTPVAISCLVYTFVFLDAQTVFSIISYVLSAYTLTLWCCKIPFLTVFFKKIKTENKAVLRWSGDTRLRINTTLYGSLLWNLLYAVFLLWLGIYHSSFWYGTLSGYYTVLGVLRFSMVRYTSRYVPGENLKTELKKYRACAIVLLFVNSLIALIVFFMVYWNRSFIHHEITTIALALYTFTAFARAVSGLIKYRKYNSPVYSASRMVNLAAACVSILTLEATMLTTFGEGTTDMLTRRILLAVTGGIVSAFIVSMSIYMIIKSNKKLHELE